MARIDNLTNFLTDVATAIKNKLNITDAIPASEFDTKIESIEKMPIINVTLSGASATYVGYITGFGAGIDNDGTLIIWAMSSNTSYEHVNFFVSTLTIGVQGVGWSKGSSFDTGDPALVPHACTVTGLKNYSVINVELNVAGSSSNNDYINIGVTVSGE